MKTVLKYITVTALLIGIGWQYKLYTHKTAVIQAAPAAIITGKAPSWTPIQTPSTEPTPLPAPKQQEIHYKPLVLPAPQPVILPPPQAVITEPQPVYPNVPPQPVCKPVIIEGQQTGIVTCKQ